jgi:hypothetical protein
MMLSDACHEFFKSMPETEQVRFFLLIGIIKEPKKRKTIYKTDSDLICDPKNLSKLMHALNSNIPLCKLATELRNSL